MWVLSSMLTYRLLKTLYNGFASPEHLANSKHSIRHLQQDIIILQKFMEKNQKLRRFYRQLSKEQLNA